MDLLPYQFLEKLKQLSFINKIYIFGSRARQDHTQTSDIDIAIECPMASGKDWLTVLDIIDNADTLLKIDCIRLDEANQELTEQILKEGKIIYARKN